MKIEAVYTDYNRISRVAIDHGPPGEDTHIIYASSLYVWHFNTVLATYMTCKLLPQMKVFSSACYRFNLVVGNFPDL